MGRGNPKVSHHTLLTLVLLVQIAPWERGNQRVSHLTSHSDALTDRSLTEEYLSAHWELLREDAVRPLREAVQQVRITPQAKEDAFGGSIGIYEKVNLSFPPI